MKEDHMAGETRDRITLKWGTLKSWHLTSDAGRELLRRYHEIGESASAMTQHDTPEQRELICEMIDECNAETIYLDWDDVDVAKAVAKRYVMEYGRDKVATGATTRRELIAAIAALLGTRGSGYTQAREDGSMFGIVEWKHFGDLPPEVLTIGDAVPTVMVAIYRWNEPKAWHVSVHCEPDEVPR